MGRFTNHEDTPDRDAYRALVGAVLRQAVVDARSRPRSRTRHEGHVTPDRGEIADAQAFLLDQARLALWVEIVGADVTRVQPGLLRAAGLTPPSPARP